MSELDMLKVKRAMSLAFHHNRMAAGELAQVSRCLALAIVAVMQEDSEKALNQLTEIHKRLENADADFGKAIELAETLPDEG